jgi:serine/threonine protein kinase/tetratricopeptide (TPR) repeat protein
MNDIDGFEQLVGPRFQIRKKLGAGGMGIVYEAFDRERGQVVALKTLREFNAQGLYRFKREFRSLADVTHVNLVRLYELFSDGATWYFSMELIPGVGFLDYVCPFLPTILDDPASTELDKPTTGLSDRFRSTSHDLALSPASNIAEPASPSTVDVEETGSYDGPAIVDEGNRTSPAIPTRAQDSPTPPDLARLRRSASQLAEAIQALHRSGQLHRDLKPSNVIVTPEGRVVVLDFGLATELNGDEGSDSVEGQTAQTSVGRVVGTFAYMAPEQVGGEPLSEATDWYSFGTILYRSLAGRLPFVGNVIDVMMQKRRGEPARPSVVAAGVPADLDDLCVELLRRDPGDRPRGDEILRRLGGSLQESPEIGSATRSTFVGRKTQLNSLREAFETVRGGGPAIAFVHGRSGSGKSSVIQRFLEELVVNENVVLLSGRCHEQESVAYKAIDTLIDSLSRHLRRLDIRNAEAFIPRDVAALARVFPVLRRVEAIAEAPQPRREIPDLQELRRRAFAALRELLARIADRRPLVLLIDDLQWGDTDSAALLADLLRPPDSVAMLLVCSYRSESILESPCLQTLLAKGGPIAPETAQYDVPVGPLTPEEGIDLALSLIGQTDLAARDLATMIAFESKGSPYFVYELVRHLREEGDFSGSMSLGSAVTLDAVLWRRVERLGGAARKLMYVLGLAGRPVPQAVACQAASLGGEGFSELATLRSIHLVRGSGPGSGDGVETYHDQIRETILKHLDDQTKVDVYGRIASTLEASDGADPEALATYFEAAGALDRAGFYYEKAAERAAETLAFDHAAGLYRHSMRCLPVEGASRRTLLTALGDALANAGRGTESARVYLEAALGADEKQAIVLERKAAHQLLSSGEVDEGLAAFETVLKRVGIKITLSPRMAIGQLLLERLLLKVRGLRFTERDASEVDVAELERIDVLRSFTVGASNIHPVLSAGFQTSNLLRALRLGEPKRIALLLCREAIQASTAGRPAKSWANRLLGEADALARKLDDPLVEATMLYARGLVSYLMGECRDAVEPLDQAVEVFRTRCTGVARELGDSLHFAIMALCVMGELGEVRSRYLVYMKEAKDRDDRYLVSSLATYCGAFSWLIVDDFERAREETTEAIGHWSKKQFFHQDNMYNSAMNYILLYSGDGPAAWQAFSKFSPILRRSLMLSVQMIRGHHYQQGARSALGAAMVARDPSPLLRVVETFSAKLAREKTAWCTPFAALCRAGIASIRGDDPTAIRLLTEAVPGFDAGDLVLFAAAAKRRLGELKGGDEGRAIVAEADAWMTSRSIKNPSRMAACYAPGFPERS